MSDFLCTNRMRAEDTLFSRREFLARCGLGMGALGMASLLTEESLAAAASSNPIVKPNDWEQVTRGGGRPAASIVGVWNSLSRIPATNVAVQARRVLANLERNPRGGQLHPYVLHAFRTSAPRTLGEVAAIYGGLFAKTDPTWQTTLSALLSDAVVRLLPNRERGQFLALRDQSDILEMAHPGTPTRTGFSLIAARFPA